MGKEKNNDIIARFSATQFPSGDISTRFSFPKGTSFDKVLEYTLKNVIALNDTFKSPNGVLPKVEDNFKPFAIKYMDGNEEKSAWVNFKSVNGKPCLTLSLNENGENKYINVGFINQESKGGVSYGFSKLTLKMTPEDTAFLNKLTLATGKNPNYDGIEVSVNTETGSAVDKGLKENLFNKIEKKDGSEVKYAILTVEKGTGVNLTRAIENANKANKGVEHVEPKTVDTPKTPEAPATAFVKEKDEAPGF